MNKPKISIITINYNEPMLERTCESEGIGMSFLEAMAMGKAVIAQDAPTMNEYIENGINGYLVDFENPKPVDLSDIEWVQKNAYESAHIGYARWQNSKNKIIKFIKKGNKK